MAQTGTLGRTPVILVVLLIVATCGAYVPIWYICIRPTLAKLKTETKLAPYLPYGLLVLYIVFIGAEAVHATSMSATGASADYFNSPLFVVYFLAHAILAARVVDILHEYSYCGLASIRCVAWLRAILLNAAYLQYEMNRLPAPVDGICPLPKDI
jgi:hypothetical protein